jgi:hypothetical protein
MIVITPNSFIAPEYNEDSPSIFLAGSIEMGTAINWQEYAINRLQNSESYIDVICNPRRDGWDSSWVQSIDNPQFNHQVTWELDHLQQADFILFNFVGGTKSPITLLELGLTAGLDPYTVVVCPDDFWRKGNVDIVCKRLGYTVYKTLDEALDDVINISRK